MPAATVTNNATGVLASNLASGGTSVTLQTGQGASFPTISGSNYFWGTLIDASNNIEIVKCTAHTAASDTFTITRAQQSTTAKAYVAGDRFEMRVTREHFNEKVSKSGDTMTGSLTNHAGVYSNAVTGTTPTEGSTLLVNSDFIYRQTRLRVDTTFPIEVSPYAIGFRATNGKCYVLYAVARNTLIEQPFFGTSGVGGITAVDYSTQLIELPEYVEGVGPIQYDEIIIATDPAEVIIIAYQQNYYAIATGLAGAGHFGLGNTTDQVRWKVIWNWADSSKAYYPAGPKKILTNNRGLTLAEANTTVWVLSDFNNIWAAGEGATGALGQNSTTDSTSWVQTQDTSGSALGFIDDAWCPINTTSPAIICRDAFGVWYGLGAGASGILGGGVVTNRLRWTTIPELPTTGVQKVMLAGQNVVVDCMILFTDGTLWGAGDNNAGSLGDGTVVLKNTYAQRATDVADFWMAGARYSTGNNTTWIKKTDGTLHTTGESAYYQCLFGITTDRNTFGQATDIPAGYTVETVWPGCAEATAFFYSRWTDGAGNYKIMAVGYAVDGVRGNDAVSGTVHSDITNLLPVLPTEIAYMEAMHSVNANRKGYGILVTTKGEMYAVGRAQPSSDGGTTYVGAPFPHRESPGFNTVFVKVKLEDYAV
jgi:hypothetical protein